jgi:hypothetical protein
MASPERELVLNKGSQRYVFRYRQGQEQGALAMLAEHAQDATTDFDWFDAEILGLKVRENQAHREPIRSSRVLGNRRRSTHLDRSQ